MSQIINSSPNENATSGKQHFHTFNALRFFAFLKVFLAHIPIVLFPVFNFFRSGGIIGVQFFFVLSGFLITHIIVSEKGRKGKLNFKDFFVRRILRIWPLFYLLLLIVYLIPIILKGFIVFNTAKDYESNLLVTAFFLENYRMILCPSLPNVLELSVMWSVCVEEHFYIIWGVLLSFLNKNNLPVLIIICLLFGPIARYIYVVNGYDPTLDIFTNIDLFAYGAIPAYLFSFRQERVFYRLNKIPRQIQRLIAFAILFLIMLLAQIKDNYFLIVSTTVMGIFASLLILLILPKDSPVKIAEKNIFSKLGVYTYGLYLYHILVVVVLIKVFEHYHIDYLIPQIAALFVILAFAFTFILSFISYQLFEKHFLKMKRFFR